MSNSDLLTDNEDVIQKLKRIPTLKSFEEKDLQDLLRLSEIREYQPEERILEQGNYDGWIYYLISGKVKIVKNDKAILVLKKTGDIFGEMGVIDGSARSADVYALEQSVCLAVDVSDINNFSINNKFAFRYIIYREFAEVLANRLRITTEELIRSKEEIEKINLANQLIIITEELSKAKEEINRLKALNDTI